MLPKKVIRVSEHQVADIRVLEYQFENSLSDILISWSSDILFIPLSKLAGQRTPLVAMRPKQFFL